MRGDLFSYPNWLDQQEARYDGLVVNATLDFDHHKSLDFHRHKTIQNLVQNKMIISDKHCTMVGHQHTPLQRNCMTMASEMKIEHPSNFILEAVCFLVQVDPRRIERATAILWHTNLERIFLGHPVFVKYFNNVWS